MRKTKELQVFIMFLLLFASLTKKELLSWNDKSRIATIRALVEHHTFIIDKVIANPVFETGDKYLYNEHFYSDKPPILSIYGAIHYYILRLFNISFETNYQLTYYLLTILTIGVLSALGLVYLYKILRDVFKINEDWANIIVLIAGTGTLVLPYSTTFNNHIVSGVLLLISCYFLFKADYSNNIVVAGLLISLAGNIEINCFLFIPFAFLYFVISKSLKSGAIFILACVPLVLIQFYLNFYLSGSIIPPAMNSALWDYPGSAFNENNLSGLATHDSISGIREYAFHMILGHRGLISHTPILLVSIFALFQIFKSNNHYKKEYLYIAFASFVFIFLYILRTNNYSGWAYGVRWYTAVMLILCLPLAHIENVISKSRLAKVLFILLANLSIMLSLIGTYDSFVRKDITLQLPILGTVKSYYTAVVSAGFIATQSSNFYKIRLVVITFIIYFVFYKFLNKWSQKKSKVKSQKSKIRTSP